MKTSFKSLLVSSILALSLSAEAADRILATINGESINETAVKRALTLGKVADTAENRKQVLNDLIDNALVQQEMARAGVRVSEADLNTAFKQVVQSSGMNEAQFAKALQAEGLTVQQYREQLQQQMAFSQFRERFTSQMRQVRSEQVEALADKMLADDKAANQVKTVKVTEYRVSHILIKTTPVLNNAQAQAKLAALSADIQSGKTTFADAAIKNSQDYVSGADGGDLGFAVPDIYDPRFAQEVQNTPKGAISAPFPSQFGWHILTVTDTREGDRTREAYLQAAYEQLMEQQYEQLFNQWLNQVKSQAKIQYNP